MMDQCLAVCKPKKMCRVYNVTYLVHFSALIGIIGYFLLGLASEQTVVHALLIALSLYGSVLLHEMGHMLAMKFFVRGCQVDIFLWLFGGLAIPQDKAQMAHAYTHKHGSKAAIHFAGPAVNLVLGFLFYRAGLTAESQLLTVIGFLNLSLFMFNMLPITPMDGGEVLLDLMTCCLPVVAACYTSFCIAAVVAVGYFCALLLLGVSGFWLVYIAVMCTLMIVVSGMRATVVWTSASIKDKNAREAKLCQLLAIGRPPRSASQALSKRIGSTRTMGAAAADPQPSSAAGSLRRQQPGGSGAAGAPVRPTTVVVVAPAESPSAGRLQAVK